MVEQIRAPNFSRLFLQVEGLSVAENLLIYYSENFKNCEGSPSDHCRYLHIKSMNQNRPNSTFFFTFIKPCGF